MYLKFTAGSRHYADNVGTHLGDLVNNSSKFELKFTLARGQFKDAFVYCL